jgi:hypothetical protein
MTLDKTFSVGEILNAGDVNGHLLSMWIPIDKRVITSGSAVTSVSWPSIDSNFRIFRITIHAGSSGGIGSVQFRFNNDSGSNYQTQFAFFSGTGSTIARTTSQTYIPVDNVGFLAGEPNVITATISKTISSIRASISGTCARDTTPGIGMIGATWNNTSALINRIDVISSAGTMYGVFALEGMRGA